MFIFWNWPLTGYQAVFLPYAVSGPNSTMACPGQMVDIVALATSGFCVLATVCMIGSGSAGPLAPHPILQALAHANANKTTTLDTYKCCMFYSSL
jgi:hypothetical protein